MTSATASCYLPVALDVAELEAQHGGELTIGEYEDLLRGLGAMARGHQWWCGDALVYGEKHFGEDVFSQAAEALGLEPHTLTNWRWVASSVTVARRRETLSWSHHEAVARLAANTQRSVLARAEKEGWTVRQIRDHVAMTYPQSQPQLFDGDVEPAGERDDVDVQKRLDLIERRLDSGDVEDDDVRWLLQLAKRLTRGLV